MAYCTPQTLSDINVECGANLGGVKVVAIRNRADITAVTIADGEVTAVTLSTAQGTPADATVIAFRDQTCQLSSEGTIDDVSGVHYYTHTLAFRFPKMSASKRISINALTHAETIAIVKDNNGTYYGVINMREPNNKQHVYANYGLDDEEIDMYEIDADSGYLQMCGTRNAWIELYENARLAALPSYYKKVEQQLDIEAFCNYMAVELYLGSTDWPKNNLKAFRPVAEGGRFRFILYDLDHSFQTNDPFVLFASRQNYTFNTLYNESVSNITQEIEVVTIFLNLLKNTTFRKRFIDTYCLIAGSVFEPTRCAELMNRLANRVADMQVIANAYGTNASPWGTTSSVINSLNSRQQPLIEALKNYGPMNIRSVTPQVVSLSSSTSAARMTVNGIYVPTGKFNGQQFFADHFLWRSCSNESLFCNTGVGCRIETGRIFTGRFRRTLLRRNDGYYKNHGIGTDYG